MQQQQKKNSAQDTTHNKQITEQTVREVLNVKTNHRTINARDTRRKRTNHRSVR